VDREVSALGLESDSSRQVLESTGWLAAHRRNQASTKQNPVDRHSNSLAGRVSPGEPPPGAPGEWRSWSMRLFRNIAAISEEAELNDA
jgi:hypothetical protein